MILLLNTKFNRIKSINYSNNTYILQLIQGGNFMKKQFLKFMILFMSFAFILLPLNTEAEGK